jgi:hypothetical protein
MQLSMYTHARLLLYIVKVLYAFLVVAENPNYVKWWREATQYPSIACFGACTGFSLSCNENTELYLDVYFSSRSGQLDIIALVNPANTLVLSHGYHVTTTSCKLIDSFEHCTWRICNARNSLKRTKLY